MVTATSIKTELCYDILFKLLVDNWKITFMYDNFDAGIDTEEIIIEKNGEEILFGWTNWDEGEIQCSESRMKEIETTWNCKFRMGEPVSLNPNSIELCRKWKDEDQWPLERNTRIKEWSNKIKKNILTEEDYDPEVNIVKKREYKVIKKDKSILIGMGFFFTLIFLMLLFSLLIILDIIKF